LQSSILTVPADDRWRDQRFSESLDRAHELFTWLAMERVAPLLARFGLGSADDRYLRLAAREYLAMYVDLDLRPGYDPETQFRRALDSIERHIGTRTRRTVDVWHAVGISDYSEYSRAIATWSDVLHDLAFDHGIQSRDRWFFVARPVLRSHLSEDYWLEAMGEAREPVDNWEVDYYAMWDRVVGHGTAPIDGLRQTLQFTDLHDAWLDLRAKLPDESIQEIRAWANRHARHYFSNRNLPVPEQDGWEFWRELRSQAE
jgi:hypothetical protein